MKVYKKGADESYTLGVFPTIELLENRPEVIKRVVVHSSIEENSGYPKIKELCNQYHIHIDIHDPTIDKLSPKNNCYAIGVFKTYEDNLERDNHVVLVNPMDMGNMGTIMRTMLGFNYNNLAIIEPACDIFNPKVIRASMGAIFSLHIKRFKSFEEYYQVYQDYEYYPFMLKGAKNIHHVHTNNLHALIFGNESSGLDDSFLNYGQSVFIPHTSKIDSLNLSQSLGIGLYHFSSAQFEDKTSLR